MATVRPDVQALSRLWDKVAFTDDESLVVDVLRLIDSKVERVGFLGEGAARNVVLKRSIEKSPVPIGSLGDGMRHLLSLALNMVAARGGTLLIDEIDHGLHHSVMDAMWNVVLTTAQRLDIQVFATTHSADCVAGLARLHRRMPQRPHELMVHRLVADQPESVPFTPDELEASDEFHGEVR
jgi:ABC-type nitrate/sulfonate/bicarbonate transport system ATPase subunit